ncbi:MAG: TlpA disulfide reductase family protein [Actinomycetota bacterium]|nr:TlpA disulfide reductase family protein [Actinomycetota bacterium]
MSLLGASHVPARRTLRRWPGALGLGALGAVVAAALVVYVVTPRPASVITRQTLPKGVSFQKYGTGAGLPELASGRVAPGFSLPNLRGGRKVSLAGFAGHPVVLNFFASWCADCRAELSAFAKVSSASHGAVRFVGIDTDDASPGKARSLLAAAGDNYPVGMDRNGDVATSRYLVQALPVTVFISADGRIAGQAFGAQTVRSLTPWLRRLELTKASHMRPKRTGDGVTVDK